MARRFCYAVDIGGTAIKFGVFGLEETHPEDFTLREKWQQPTDKSDSGIHILPDVAEGVRTHMEKHGIQKEQVAGVGVGIPGTIEESGMVRVAPNLGWRMLDVNAVLSELLDGISVCTINDANAAALGEAARGGGRNFQSMVLLTLGTGVGGGVVLNGDIVTGFAGAAGEIGHLCVNDRETTPCNCGRYGCLEQYSSATGIVRTYETLVSTGINGSLSLEAGITAKDVFDAWLGEEPDAAADAAVETLGYYLGKACAAVCCVIAPQVIVIGGGVSHAGEPLLHLIEEKFAQFAYPACKDTSFALAQTGNDAGIYGCAYLVCKKTI